MKTLRKLLVLFVLAPGSASSALAGRAAFSSETPSAEANAAWEAKDWGMAAMLYEELSKEKDAPPRVWFAAGHVAQIAGKYDQALAAFDKATQIGAGPFGEYGKGATYAAMKQTDKAFESLDKAMQQGMRIRMG
jgi:tetratricopeptide (TPR) repeat protein